MRPRSFQSVPGLDPEATPFERLQEFARMIVAVPKSEVEKLKNGSGPARTRKKGKGQEK
jgi:hypothetical protein